MPDREKVIKGLECCNDTSMASLKCEECPYRETDTCSAIARLHVDALILLREQEPVKPMVVVDTCICGNCGTPLERQSMVGENAVLAELFDYCPHCGRKVKWE